jgi:hypothetical protein
MLKALLMVAQAVDVSSPAAALHANTTMTVSPPCISEIKVDEARRE